MNVKKFLISFLLINMFIIIISLSQNIVNATTLTDMQDAATSFIDIGSKKADISTDSINSITSSFVGLGQILTMVGAGVMVAVTSYMGIKYLMSPPDKQAALKQQLIGLVVAGIVIFGAYGIWRAVVNVVSKF